MTVASLRLDYSYDVVVNGVYATTELCVLWSELSRRKLSTTLATAHCSCPENAIGLVAHCELTQRVR